MAMSVEGSGGRERGLRNRRGGESGGLGGGEQRRATTVEEGRVAAIERMVSEDSGVGR